MAENRIYGYARVSKMDKMTLENQEYAINKWAEENNVKIHRIYRDKCKGDTPVEERTELPDLLDELREGDVVVVFECFRLHRSPSGLQDLYREIIEKKKAEFVTLNPMEQVLCTYNNGNNDIVQQGFKQIILAVMSVMGAIEKKNVSVRTKNSLASRKAQGKILGKKRLEMPLEFIQRYKNKTKAVTIMNDLGLSKTSYYKLIRFMQMVEQGKTSEEIRAEFKVRVSEKGRIVVKEMQEDSYRVLYESYVKSLEYSKQKSL